MPTRDFYVTTVPRANIRGFRLFDFGGPRTVGVQGFYRVILQWLKCFMTEQGSDLSDAGYGTLFGSLLGHLSNDPAALRDVIALSINAATETIRKYQQGFNFPAGERLATVEFTNLIVLADRAEIYVTLKSVAGDAIQILVPSGTRSPLPSES